MHVIKEMIVPSTGEYCPYVHQFFGFADKSTIAFFDLGDNAASVPDPAAPSWVDHFAMQVDSVADLLACCERLIAHGIEVVRPTDHHVIQSIYFFDSNGFRLERTLCLPADNYVAQKQVREQLDRGAVRIPFLQPGDRANIEMCDREGRSIFGAIEQTVQIRARTGARVGAGAVAVCRKAGHAPAHVLGQGG